MTGFGLSKWNKLNIKLLKKYLDLAQNTYPELMGKLFICNAPLIFTGIFSIIKGWLDEQTQKKIQVIGSNFHAELFKYCDEDQVPTCLGGSCKQSFTDDFGPWNDYEFIDGSTPEEIGVRRKDDPFAKLFGPKDMMKLENPHVKGSGVMGTKGAVMFDQNGKVIANMNADKSTNIDDALHQNNNEEDG